MRITTPRSALATFTIVIPLLLSGGAFAQVVIDMPPPPRPRMQPTILASQSELPETTITTSGSTTTIGAAAMPAYPVSTQMPEVGEVALHRYSSARRGTYDTYFNDGSYYSNGIRYISYPNYIPQFVWGPWGGWGWWGGVWPGRCW